MDNNTERFIAGEAAAYAAVYKQYHLSVMAYCYRSTRCHETAEELTQDIFLKLYHARERIEPKQGVKNYLMAIARTTVLGWFRKAHYDHKIKQEFLGRYQRAQHAEDTERSIHAAIDLKQLKSALSELPPKGQQAFQMVRIEDKSYEETSLKLSISINTVKYHLKKADRSLRTQRWFMDDLCPIVVLLATLWR